jgi:DNA-binding CsgD family transcriptional regulator
VRTASSKVAMAEGPRSGYVDGAGSGELGESMGRRGVRARRFTHEGGEFLVVSFPLDVGDGAEVLTPAEREVAAMVVGGMSNRAIAAARGTSENTVANQLKAIYKKVGVASRIELVAWGKGGR